MIDITRPTRNQVRFEDAAQVLADATFNKIATEMRAADQARVGRITHRAFESASNADLFERLRHAPRTLDPSRTDRGQTVVQYRISAVESETQDMNLQPLPLDRDLDAVDEGHPQFFRDRPC